MIPVYINDGRKLPDETCYVLAGNGVFIHKTGIIDALVKVENCPILPDLTQFIRPNFPPIPAHFVSKIKMFFERITKERNTEANVLVYYNTLSKNFEIEVPQQFATKGSVVYSKKLTKDGFLCIGSIHSHCDFSAFHSGVDIQDESHFDGLHVTFGHTDKEKFSISASLVANNFRVIVDPTSVLEGLKTEDGYYTLLNREDVDLNSWMKKVYA